MSNSTNLVMTNAGMRSRQKSNVDDSHLDGSFSLPPLGKTGGLKDEVFSDAGSMVSPARRSRMKNIVGDLNKSVVQASLDLGQMDREMALVRDNHREYGRGLMELWVNQILEPSGAGQPRYEPLKTDASTLKGLIGHGLARVELRGAGLTDAAIDRLYRGLYVYTIGFFDVMQDILTHSEFRVEILGNVWRAYLKIAESALKVAFKSEYLQLFQSQQITAAELLVAKEALSEAKLDSYNTEKALAWLTAAHAEERALRVSVRAQMNDIQSRLELEQRAHQGAVMKYVTEVETSSKLKAELELTAQKLIDSALSHAELIRQRDEIQADFNDMEEKCVFVFNEISAVTLALLMDESLSCPKDLREAAVNGSQDLSGVKAKATVLKLLALQMHSKWQAQTAELRGTSQKLYEARDELRAEKSVRFDTKVELDNAMVKISKMERLLGDSNQQKEELTAQVALLQSELAEALRGKADAEDEARLHLSAFQALQPMIKDTAYQRDQIQMSLTALEATIPPLHSRIAELEASLHTAQWVGREMSKGLASVMPSIQANQTARRCLQTAVKKERDEIAVQSRVVEELRRNVRVLEGKLEEMEEESKKKEEEVQLMTRVTKENMQLMEEARIVADEKSEAASILMSKIAVLKRDNERIAEELKTSSSALKATEDLQKADKDEVMRLFGSLQALEQEVQHASDERMELVRKLDRHQQQSKLLEEKARRKEEMLNVEAKRLEAELQMERTNIESLELTIESQRKMASELEDALARKREKKKRWKVQALEGDEEILHLQRDLDAKTSLIEGLEERLRHVDVDLAILVADRGRPLPRFLQQGFIEGQGDNDNYSSPSPAPPLPVIPSHLLPPELQVDPQPSEGSDTIMVVVQKQYDEINRRAIATQVSLDSQDKVLEEARRGYERSRAVFHVNPTDPILRERMEAKESELAAARALRSDLEKQLLEVGELSRALQARIRHHEHSLTRKRMLEIERRTGLRDASVRSEISARCDEAEARAREVTELLAKQRVAYDMLAATRNVLDSELQQQEQELQEGLYRLQKVTQDKIELENNLRQARGMVQHLQDLVLGLNAEKDKLNKVIADNDFEVERVKKEGGNALNAGQVALRQQGDKFAEELLALNKSFEIERVSLEDKIAQLTRLSKEAEGHRAVYESHATNLTRAYLTGVEYEDPPDFFSHFSDPKQPQPLWEAVSDVKGSVALAVTGARPAHSSLFRSILVDLPSLTPPPCNFLRQDPLVDFIAMPLDTTLVLISQLLTEKMIRDLKGEEGHLGGLPGPRSPFNLVIYEFFIARFGPRQSSEMHLSAFLSAVEFFKQDHPKVRMFARLIGMDDLGLGPLPRSSLDFYIALLNRIHARAGPLIGEAAEGNSYVKCRVVAKAMRDMIRGSFGSLCNEGGNITDFLLQLSSGNEEQPLDLDLALEIAFKAWVKQYKIDYDAVMDVYLGMFNIDGPKIICQDDFVDFLKQLNGPKLMTLSQQQIASMFRQASISDGPQPSKSKPSSFVHAVLDQGFVGVATHISLKLETVASFPPYDEFRLLEDAWRNLRPIIDAQIKVIQANSDKIFCDIDDYLEQAHDLELALDERNSPARAWCRFRRLMAVYLSFKKPCDKISPFEDQGRAAGIDGRLQLIRHSEGEAVRRVSEEKARVRASETVDAEASRSKKVMLPEPSPRDEGEGDEGGGGLSRTLMSQTSSLFGRQMGPRSSGASVSNLRIKSQTNLSP